MWQRHQKAFLLTFLLETREFAFLFGGSKLTCKCNTKLCKAKGESRDLLDCNAAVTSRISFCFLSKLFLSGFSSFVAAQVTRSLPLLACPEATCRDVNC